MKIPQLVAIDLDGTLIDTVPDILPATDKVMTEIGFPKRSVSQIREWVGNGAEHFVRRALLGKMDGEVEDTAFLQKARRLFIQYYVEENGKQSYLYEGVREGLDWLKLQGCRLVCVTNKPERCTIPLLKMRGIFGDFDLILSGDSLERKKPDPLPLLYALQFFNTSAENAMMLGDSASDILSAKAAKMPVICVNYGYNHGNDIRFNDPSPDVVIDSFLDLKEILKT
jgi:phosphoglycolate phosphatase